MHEPVLPADAFRLGSLVVVPSLNRLVREGQTTDVEPRVMRVLAALAATPGEVVTRAELFETVWSDAVVNDEALTRAVSELRRALGDEARGAIETIRGRGYRLALPIERVGAHERRAGDPATLPAAVPPPEASERSPADPLSVPGEESEAVSPPGRRVSPPVRLALVLASVSLAVSLWAVWPDRTDRPEPGQDAASATEASAPEPMRLDSTSEYYVPGISELGVYHDSSTGNYFMFARETDSE